ncbi:MAG: hypothetical protein IJQ85_10675 [Selenomonadaceae bacterium]|nr:hypothetical protein [Selenomonadaceae bacterium]
MNAYKKRGIPLESCKYCGTAFSKELNICPNCHFDRRNFVKRASLLPDEIYKMLINPRNSQKSSIRHYQIEGTGRGHHGAACDICPHCHGSPSWCPLLD